VQKQTDRQTHKHHSTRTSAWVITVDLRGVFWRPAKT